MDKGGADKEPEPKINNLVSATLLYIYTRTHVRSRPVLRRLRLHDFFAEAGSYSEHNSCSCEQRNCQRIDICTSIYLLYRCTSSYCLDKKDIKRGIYCKNYIQFSLLIKLKQKLEPEPGQSGGSGFSQIPWLRAAPGGSGSETLVASYFRQLVDSLKKKTNTHISGAGAGSRKKNPRNLPKTGRLRNPGEKISAYNLATKLVKF